MEANPLGGSSPDRGKSIFGWPPTESGEVLPERREEWLEERWRMERRKTSGGMESRREGNGGGNCEEMTERTVEKWALFSSDPHLLRHILHLPGCFLDCLPRHLPEHSRP